MPAHRIPSAPTTPLAKPVDTVPSGTLTALRAQAQDCRRCDLWKPATQVVFGAGPARAPLMIIGEQPGDQEDQQGRPFVGPAGQLLGTLMADAGLDPAMAYVTNTVKHFKFVPRGKRRLHQRATAGEQAACRPWLAAELLRVRPRIVLALGAMAAQTLFGNAFRLTTERGQWRALDGRTTALASWHRSAILRMREPDRTATRALLREDLAQVAAALDNLR